MFRNRSQNHLIALAGIVVLTVAFSPVHGQTSTISVWNNRNAASTSWSSEPNWFQFTTNPSAVPNGSGSIALVTADITVNQLINLGGTQTFGTLHLGDSSSTQIYTIGALGPTDRVSFDNQTWGGTFNLGGRAALNKVQGGADSIADVLLVSDLAIYNRVAFTIAGGIDDAGGQRSLLKLGTSNLTLTGANSYSGDTIIYTTGGTTTLNTVGSNAINSPIIRLGNSTRDGNVQTFLTLGRSDQINDGTVIRYDGRSGAEAFLRLNGFNETIQGISDYTGRGIVENIGAGQSTFTVNTAGNDYSFNGFIRNNGTGALLLTKTGAGTLNISGGNLSYTGLTTVSQGALEIANATAFNSAVSVALGATLSLQATADWRMPQAITGAGALIRETGANTVSLQAVNTYTGPTSIKNGTLRVGAFRTTTSNAATLVGAGARITATSGISISANGTLNIANRSDGNHTDRIVNSAPITMSGGNVVFTNNGDAATNYSETLGAVTLTGGLNTFQTGKIHLDTGTPTPPTPADAASAVLTLTSLTRTGTATVNFTSTTLGPALGTSAANRIMITSAPTLDDGVIGAWATVGNEWATYDGVNGVSAYSAYNTGAFGTWTSASNVKLTGANQTLGASNITINTLNLQDTAARTLALNGRELTIAAGGILASGANHVIGTSVAATTGALKASTNEFTVTVGDTNARTLTIFSTVAETGVGTKLVKTGGGTLILSPAQNTNTYTGGTTINGGSIEIKNFATLGANTNANFLKMDGGALEIAANQNITILGGGRQITVGSKGGRFEIDLNESLTIDAAVPISGPGPLTIGGADATGGTVNLNGVLSMQGGLTVTTGTVTLNNALNTFSGGLNVSGGIVRVPVTGALPNDQALNLTGGILRFVDGPDVQIASLTGSANGRIESSVTTLGSGPKPLNLIVNQISDTTYAGLFTDSDDSIFNLIKTGTGTLTLSNDSSTYRGYTRIDGGILAIQSMNYYMGSVTTASSIGVGDPFRIPNSAESLFISSGAALSYVGTIPSFTDRSFTIGTGSEAGGLFANGTVVGAKLVFQEFVGENVQFDTPDVGATFTLGGRNAGNNTFGLKLTDNGTGYLSLVKTGPGTWVLDNLNGSNDYSGSTTIYEGRLAITGDGALGKKGEEGPPVQLVGGVLDLRNVNYTASAGKTEDLIMAGGRLDTSVGTSSWAGKINITSTFAPNINVARDAQLTLGNIDGVGLVDKDSFGTLVMAGVNSYTGSTRVRDGNLVLDYSTTPGDNKLSNSATLAFGGGRTGATMELRNTSGTTVTEVVNNLTLDRGQHEILLDNPATPLPGAAGSAKIQFTSITRNTGGILDIEMGGLAATATNNLVPTDANSILGSWATIAHTDWARKNAGSGILGDIMPVSTYAINTWQTVSPNNTDVQISNTQTNATTNTLRFNQASTPTTVTLSGVNTINAGGILVTPNVGVGALNQIQGGTLTVGPSNLSGSELVIQQFSTNAGFVIGSVIADRVAAPATVVGLEKLGPGSLTLTGANTYTGVTIIAGGALRVDSLGNGGSPSPLGAATAAPANIVIGGGTLEYTGDNIVSNRGFTVKDFGAFNVGDEDMTVTITGSDVTGSTAGNIVGDAGTAVWDKTGAGTLRLLRLEVSGGASGIQELNVADGKLKLEYGYSTVPDTGISPTGPNATDRIFNTNANLTMSGGKLELVGDDFVFGNGQSFQRFFGQFTVGAGASEIKVTSQTSLATLIDQTTTLGIGDTNSPLPIIRELGGTVLFVENPNGGVAKITLSTVAVDQGVVIPWATYLDTTNTGQPGVNNFAAIEQTDDGIVSADTKSLYSTKSDPVNWLNNGLEHISEEGATPFGGAAVTNGKIASLRFFTNFGAGTITVTPGSTLTLTQGAMLMAYNSRNNTKTLTGGTLTSTYLPADGQAELMLHNYNTGNQFVLNSVIADPTTLAAPAALNLVHTGTGTTSLQAANTYTGGTLVTGGVLKLDNLTAIPGGVAVSAPALTSSPITLDGGVIGLTSASGDFTRGLGTAKNQVQWTSSGGFAAYGVDRNVNLGGSGSPSLVSWGRGGFVPSGDTLVLGSQDADKKITFMNPIDLGAADRLVRVENGRATEDAVMAGALSGEGSLTKNGEGTLRLTGTNVHTGGTTLAEGTLYVPNASVLGTGPVAVGTTGNTEANDAVVLVLEGGSISNLLNVGTKNSVGITTIEAPNDVALNGAVTVDKAGLFLGPDSGKALSVNGAISGSGSLRLVDGGTLKLFGNNSYGTGAGVNGAGTSIDGGTIIRNGTIELNSATGLGNGTKALELGDVKIAAVTVDRATTGASLILSRGSFDPKGAGFLGSTNGIGAFYGVSNQLDGVTYTTGDANIDQSLAKLILVKDQFDNPEQNGVYYIYSVDTVAGTMNLARVATPFPQVPVQNGYGQDVLVQNGTLNGGTTFFLAANVDTAKFTDADGPLNTDPFYWKVETSQNPNVALTINAALSSPVTNPIDINATNGTGTTSIGYTGTVLHGSTTLSGSVTLQSQSASAETKDLLLSAGGGAELIFSGAVTDPGTGDKLNLVKNGTGVVTLSGTNNFDGTATVNGGVLKLDNSAALGGALGANNAGSGNVNLNGGVIGLTANSGNFSRTLGTAAGQIQWTAAASGGFAAYGTNQTATVNSGAALTWGTTPQFLTTGSLVLGAPSATAKVAFTNPVVLGSAARTVNVPNGPAAVEGELSGVISGGAGGVLTKTGQGTLLLSGNNTYTAGTLLAQGTLQGKRTTSGNAFGTAAISVGGTGTQLGDALKLEFLGDDTSNTTYSVTNTITIGTQNRNGTDRNGITSIDATHGSAVTNVSDVDLTAALALPRDIFVGPDANAKLKMSGVVSGTGRITVVDGGTLQLTNTNTYGTTGGTTGASINGGTVIRNGTIEVNAAGSLGGTVVELGDIRSNIAVTVDRASGGMALTDNGANFSAGTFTGVATDFGGGNYTVADIGKNLLVKDENASPERNGIYQITAVSGTDMSLVRVSQFDNVGGTEMVYGSTVQVVNGPVPGQSYFMASPTVTTVNTSPVIWRDTATNPNVALLASAAITVANNIDLNATVSTGTNSIGAVSTLTTGTVTFSGTITQQNINVAASETMTLDLDSSLITTTTTGLTLTGVISDGAETLQVRKVGNGVATLTNANTYDGGTLVNAGVLLVNNATGSGTGTGSVSVTGAGTVLGGTGTISGATTIGNGAFLQPGTGVSDANATFDSAIESLAFGSSLNLTNGSTSTFQLLNVTAGNYDQVTVGGALTVGSTALLKVVLASGFSLVAGNQFNLLDWASISTDGDLRDQIDLPTPAQGATLGWDLSLLNSQGIIMYAPEPSRMVLVAVGAIAMLFGRRRKQRF